jgi:hypothetical protein
MPSAEAIIVAVRLMLRSASSSLTRYDRTKVTVTA